MNELEKLAMRAAQKITITYADVTEYQPHDFTAEASDLGFPVEAHKWQRQLATTMGNKLSFYAIAVETRDGEVQWIDYAQANGCIRLRVFND